MLQRIARQLLSRNFLPQRKIKMEAVHIVWSLRTQGGPIAKHRGAFVLQKVSGALP